MNQGARNSENKGVLLTQMSEAWKDGRSYTSVIWQVSALSLTVVGLAISANLGVVVNGQPLFNTFLGWMILVFGLIVTSLSIFMMEWFMNSVIARCHAIHSVEKRLGGLDIEIFNPMINTKIPVSDEIGFGLQMLTEWRDIPDVLGTLFLALNMILGMASLTLGLSLLVWIDPLNAAMSIMVIIVLPFVLVLNAFRLAFRISKRKKQYVNMMTRMF